MALHQIFGQEQISNRWQDRDQQNTDGAFSLIEQTPDESERAFEVAHCQSVAQFKDDSRARKRNELAHKIDIYLPIFPKVDVDLLQFVVDLARIAASEQDEQFQCVVVELQFSFGGARPNHFAGFFFPSAAAGIESIDHLHF